MTMQSQIQKDYEQASGRKDSYTSSNGRDYFATKIQSIFPDGSMVFNALQPAVDRFNSNRVLPPQNVNTQPTPQTPKTPNIDPGLGWDPTYVPSDQPPATFGLGWDPFVQNVTPTVPSNPSSPTPADVTNSWWQKTTGRTANIMSVLPDDHPIKKMIRSMETSGNRERLLAMLANNRRG